MRKLDGVIFSDHPYVMNWYLPCERFIYWNKFGMPDTIPDEGVQPGAWWIDGAKEPAITARQKR